MYVCGCVLYALLHFSSDYQELCEVVEYTLVRVLPIKSFFVPAPPALFILFAMAEIKIPLNINNRRFLLFTLFAFSGCQLSSNA